MQTSYGANEYRQNDIMGASPIRLVVIAYDLAIAACEQKNLFKATKAIGVLRDALDFDVEMSVQLFSIYQWILEKIRGGEWQEASRNLKELREAWVVVEKQTSPAPIHQDL